MSDGFTIAAASAASTLFECPSCNETIDSSADKCRFCGAVVDHEAAVKAAQLLSKVNQACSDASYMRSCAGAILVFFLLRFVPFIASVGWAGFYALLVVVPIWSVIWWIRYARLASTEDDFKRARSTVRWTGIVTGLLLLLFVIAPFALGAINGLRSR